MQFHSSFELMGKTVWKLTLREMLFGLQVRFVTKKFAKVVFYINRKDINVSHIYKSAFLILNLHLVLDWNGA